MTAKVLPPARLAARARSGAAGGDICPAARPGRGSTTIRFHRMAVDSGKSGAIGGRYSGPDRLGAGGMQLRYSLDDSAQTGGTTAGP